MPRPDDEWFRKQRIEGLIGPVDTVLEKVGALRRVAARCEQLVITADPKKEVQQRQELRELAPMLDQFHTQTTSLLDTLRQAIDLLGDPVLRSRGLSALRLMSDDLNLEEIGSSEAYLDKFERRLLRNLQAEKIRRSRDPATRQADATEREKRTALQHLRPSPAQIHAVPQRRGDEHEQRPERGKLVESPITIIERSVPAAPGTLTAAPGTVGTDTTSPTPVQSAPPVQPSDSASEKKPKQPQDEPANRFAMLDIDWDD